MFFAIVETRDQKDSYSIETANTMQFRDVAIRIYELNVYKRANTCRYGA